MIGRPFIAYGIWPDMIRAAGGVAELARALGVTDRGLRFVLTGSRSPWPKTAARARAFARRHEITMRVFQHPSLPGALLVSSASGWFRVPRRAGGWDEAQKVRRGEHEDWSALPMLELDFASSWAEIAGAPV